MLLSLFVLPVRNFIYLFIYFGNNALPIRRENRNLSLSSKTLQFLVLMFFVGRV